MAPKRSARSCTPGGGAKGRTSISTILPNLALREGPGEITSPALSSSFPAHPLDGVGEGGWGRVLVFLVFLVFFVSPGTVGPRRFPKTPPNNYPAPPAKNSPPVAGRNG